MNLFQLQERIKDFSKDQLVKEMQQPSGAVPPFLVLSELQRRTRMEKAFQAEQAQGQQSTVAQDAIAAAGVPQGGIADMARAMAPQTDMAGNTGAMPVQNMQEGGEVEFRMPATPPGGSVVGLGALVNQAMQGKLDPNAMNGAGWVNAMAAQHLAGLLPANTSPTNQNITAPPMDQSGVDTQFMYSRMVPRLAEGGVVRMQPGGLAGVSRDVSAYSPTMGGARGPQRPRLVVRNGIQYAEMPDGSLIPIGELGFSPEQQAGIDSADLSAPTGFTAPSTGSLPTQADLDQRFADRDLGITGTARQLGSPSLSDIPQLPDSDAAQNALGRLRPTQFVPARDLELPLVQSLLGENSLDIRVPPSAESLGFVPEGEGQYTEALRSDIERQRRRLTPADYQSRGETDPLDPRSPSYVPPVPDDFDYQNARYNEAEAARMMELNAIPFAGGEYVPPPTSAAPSALSDEELAAIAGVSPGVLAPVQGPNLPSPSVDPSELGGLPDFMKEQGGTVPMPQPGQGIMPSDIGRAIGEGLGFGPAMDAARETRSLEETLAAERKAAREAEAARMMEINEIPATARKVTDEGKIISSPQPKKDTDSGGTGGGARAAGTADADKWLALAQFGLGLMASQAPTLGGAIGEAGTMALSQLRESQKEAYERDLAERTLAARSARGSQFPAAGANLFSEEVAALMEQLADPMVKRDPKLRDNLQSQLDTLLAKQRLLQAAYLSQYGLSGALGASAPAGDLSTVPANVSDK